MEAKQELQQVTLSPGTEAFSMPMSNGNSATLMIRRRDLTLRDCENLAAFVSIICNTVAMQGGAPAAAIPAGATTENRLRMHVPSDEEIAGDEQRRALKRSLDAARIQ